MKYSLYVLLLVAGLLLGGCSTLDDVIYVKARTAHPGEGRTLYLVGLDQSEDGQLLYRLVTKYSPRGVKARPQGLLCESGAGKRVEIAIYKTNLIRDESSIPSADICEYFRETYSRSLRYFIRKSPNSG